MNPRHRFSFILGIIIVLSCAAAAPAAEVTAVCDGAGTMHLRARFQGDELGTDWQGVVVQRSVVGECGTEVVLNDPPLTLLPGQDFGDHEFTDNVPYPDATYRYALQGVTADGGLVDLTDGVDRYRPTWFVIAACVDDALIMRGTLHASDQPYRVLVEPCVDSCWEICVFEPLIGVLDLDPEQYEPFLDTGLVMNVYGQWDNYPPEVSWGCLVAERMEIAGGCAGPVPVQSSSWGTLKAEYR